MKIYEPNIVKVEIEKEEMGILSKAYDILESLSDGLEYYEGKEVKYSAFGVNEDDFYEFLSDMKSYISSITNKW